MYQGCSMHFCTRAFRRRRCGTSHMTICAIISLGFIEKGMPPSELADRMEFMQKSSRSVVELYLHMSAFILRMQKSPDFQIEIRGFSSWQGQKDSNSQERFWRPLCYHYIMPLWLNERIIAFSIVVCQSFLCCKFCIGATF